MMLPTIHIDTRILICAKTESATATIANTLSGKTTPSEPRCVNGLAAAREALGKTEVDCLLLDSGILLEERDAAAALLKEHSSQTAVILIGSTEHEADLWKAVEQGADDFIFEADLDPGTIDRSIRKALVRRRDQAPTRGRNPQTGKLEMLLQRIFNNHPDPMLVLGSDHTMRFLNAAAVSLFETEETSVIGDVFPFAVEPGKRTELEIPSSGNIVYTVELNASEIHWEGEHSLLVFLRETTTEWKAGQNLQREQERLNGILDTISEPVILTDSEGRIEQLNRRAKEWFDLSRGTFAGLHFTEIVKLKPSHEKDSGLKKSTRGGLPHALSGPREIKAAIDLGSGKERAFTASINALFDKAGRRQSGIIVLRQDTPADDGQSIEHFKNEAHKSVSLLAGGIAHDFNNMLTAILGNIALARMAEDEPGVVASKLKAAEFATLQAKSLSQQLLTFARGGALPFKRTNIADIIDESARFILRGSNVDFEIGAEDELWQVDADKGQLSQVINNLLINADQAMFRGGRIRIYLRNLQIRRAEVPNLNPGEYVCIEIKDSGSGIPPENLKQIFTPYFTTKEEGNGLGLASSFSIALHHKGTITADSSPGYGSVFRVYLPRSLSQDEPNEEPEPNNTMDDQKTIRQGHGRILLMDDMEAMLMVAGEILEMLGYEVECSDDGEKAIEVYKGAKESGQPFDAVIFDLTVPGGMGGEEAANILKEYDPDLVAIASSGYSNSNIMSDYKNSAFKAVVPKPYRIDEMSDTLHSILNDPDERS